MTEIVVVGTGLARGSTGRARSAAGQRAHQFAAGLRASGARVRLLIAGAPGDEESQALEDDVELFPAEHAEQHLARILERAPPTAVVGAGSHGSYLACRAAGDLPLWVDLNGDPAAEGQAAAGAAGNDQPLCDHWWLLSWCLRRGDRFSAVSAAQRLALLGQLGACGRLNRATLGAEIVHAVPESAPELATRSPGLAEPIVLFSGSFNTWTDGDTLAEALRLALHESPRLRFVATGGAVPGVPDLPWRRFRERLERLEPDSLRRAEIRGWVAEDELERIEETVSCGVVPELPIPERELGGHNRSLRWMMRAIPVVTTTLSELGREAAGAGAAIAYRPGDPRSLADAILRCSSEPDAALDVADRARSWALERRSVAATTAPLAAWARDPRPAPDRADGSAERLARRHAEMLRDQLFLRDTDG